MKDQKTFPPFTLSNESGCAMGSRLLKRARERKGILVTRTDRPKQHERLETVLAHFVDAGFARREPALLQPAGVAIFFFLTFLTTDVFRLTRMGFPKQ